VKANKLKLKDIVREKWDWARDVRLLVINQAEKVFLL
jgi:hypothetical protein